VNNAQGAIIARIIGVFVFGLGLWIAFLVWPAGITDLPLGAITLGSLLWALLSVVIAVVFFVFALLVFWL
jgi:hypothetical protein